MLTYLNFCSVLLLRVVQKKVDIATHACSTISTTLMALPAVAVSHTVEWMLPPACTQRSCALWRLCSFLKVNQDEGELWLGTAEQDCQGGASRVDCAMKQYKASRGSLSWSSAHAVCISYSSCTRVVKNFS